MPSLFPHPDDPLDRAVRTHLEEEARTADVAGVLERVQARETSSARRPRRWRVLVPLALAASVFLALLVGLTGPPGEARARPADVLERAQRHHAQAPDN